MASWATAVPCSRVLFRVAKVTFDYTACKGRFFGRFEVPTHMYAHATLATFVMLRFKVVYLTHLNAFARLGSLRMSSPFFMASCIICSSVVFGKFSFRAMAHLATMIFSGCAGRPEFAFRGEKARILSSMLSLAGQLRSIRSPNIGATQLASSMALAMGSNSIGTSPRLRAACIRARAPSLFFCCREAFRREVVALSDPRSCPAAAAAFNALPMSI